MSYTLDSRAVLGSSNTGKAIGYRLVNTSGVIVQAFTTTNVVETGVLGTYRVNGGLVMPDGFRGGVVWGTAGQDLAEMSVNPEEAENLNQKVSTLPASFQDAPTTGHTTIGTVGGDIHAAAEGSDPDVMAQAIWSALRVGPWPAGSFGEGLIVYQNNDKVGYKLASDALDSIVVEPGMNGRQVLAVIASALAGLVEGAGSNNIRFKGAKNPTVLRIDAVVDKKGNRTQIVLNLPA